MTYDQAIDLAILNASATGYDQHLVETEDQTITVIDDRMFWSGGYGQDVIDRILFSVEGRHHGSY